MTALWISLAVAVAVLLVWRIRRAAKLLDRIMDEELDQPAAEPAEPHAEQRKR